MCTMNSMPYIMTSIESFKKQKYKNKELIIVNSKSKDNTEEYLLNVNDKNIRKYNFNGSIYNALNFGISRSKGEIVGILHSDDVFYSDLTLSHVAKEYNKHKPDVIFGNILYSSKNDLTNIKRSWSKIRLLNKYDIPPHTGTFVSKDIYKKNKYSKKYFISSDTDFLIKIFSKKIKYKYLNTYISIMRSGGLSTNIYYFFKKMSEDLSIYKNYNLSFFDYIKKLLSKIKQFFTKKKYKIDEYHKNLNYISKIHFFNIKKFDKTFGKVISALNLAFVTYNYKFNLRTQNYLFWPDGVFSSYMTNIKKIPGRVFFLKIIKKINQNVKKYNKIFIVGNLPSISKIWIKKNLKFSYTHINLPYDNIEKLLQKVDRIKFLNHSLIILTLPTPKQELIANKIIKKYPYTNIICIGGSINILSGYEKKTPMILYKLNLEWLWRLKFDSKRRFLRLLESLFLLIKIKLTGKNTIY